MKEKWLCSIATDKNGLLTQGDFNEFASDLKIVEVEIKNNGIKGTRKKFIK